MIRWSYFVTRIFVVMSSVVLFLLLQADSLHGDTTMYQLVGDYALEQLSSPGDDFVLLGDRFISLDVRGSIYTVSTTYYDPMVDTLYTTGHVLGGRKVGEYSAWFDFSPYVTVESQRIVPTYDFDDEGIIQNTENFVCIEQFDELFSLSLVDPIWIQIGEISLGEAYLYHQHSMVPITIVTSVDKGDGLVYGGYSSKLIMEGMSGTPVIQNNRLVGVLYAMGRTNNNYVFIKPILY